MELYKENQLKVYNSLSKSKEEFKSITEGRVGMYVCGPTVYSHAHLGNCRTYVSFDIINRYLTHLGYKVRYVRNITDVGHLTDDGDQGDDKMLERAKIEQLEPMEIAKKYADDFHSVLRKLNLIPPNIEPTATGHIIEQIEIIQKLIAKGFAYESKGSVYFDVLAYDENNDYGTLSKRRIEDLISNTRDLDGQSEKRNPLDFALWKNAQPEHIMRWASPWGDGFPGWHLECTAMSTKYLGQRFDIHGGGMDLKFPHHECEIAQAKGAFDEDPVNYWMHANMLTMNGQKMSKSTGNTILPNELFSGNNDIFDKGFSPAVVRFFMLQAHYRSILDFSNEALLASEKGYQKLIEAVKALKSIEASKTSDFDVKAWKQKCYDAMNDDFNSPILIAHLFEAVKYINQLSAKKAQITANDLTMLKDTLNAFVFDVLGLLEEEQQDSSKIDGVIEMLIQMRKDARTNKDWALSDKIRDDLAALGIQLKDGREGTTFTIS